MNACSNLIVAESHTLNCMQIELLFRAANYERRYDGESFKDSKLQVMDKVAKQQVRS